jgi:hypothetical protein
MNYQYNIKINIITPACKNLIIEDKKLRIIIIIFFHFYCAYLNIYYFFNYRNKNNRSGFDLIIDYYH